MVLAKKKGAGMPSRAMWPAVFFNACNNKLPGLITRAARWWKQGVGPGSHF